VKSTPSRIGFFYGGPREPDDQTNPYGNLLADALGRVGMDVSYETILDEAFLHERAGQLHALHLHWPSHEYRGPDAVATRSQMHRMVQRLELARALGFGVVWTAHNIMPHDPAYSGIDREFRVALCQVASAIIAHCDQAAEAVRREFAAAAPIFVIPHGNFIGVLPASVTREEARADAGIGASDFVYGFIGNLLPYKGLEDLIAAFLEIDSSDSWLYLAGGCRSDYEATLRAVSGGHPRIILRTFDYAPGVAFVKVLQASDVIVLPFRASTTSGSLAQALSWPRPAIVPAMGCLPTQMDPEAGILYRADAPGALTEAMRAIRGRDLAAAERAAWRSASALDWDEIARMTIEAYRA
jgi:beta-1,4-mannosyltransferase